MRPAKSPALSAQGKAITEKLDIHSIFEEELDRIVRMKVSFLCEEHPAYPHVSLPCSTVYCSATAPFYAMKRVKQHGFLLTDAEGSDTACA